MQRRAAALYGAFFLLIAVGSYGMIAAASPPTLSVENPDHRLADGGQVSVDGRTYDVSIDAESTEASLSWTDPDAEYSQTWEAGAEVSFQGTDYTVSIPDETDPSSLQLTEVRPLPEDVQTTTVNDTEFVVIEQDDGTRELIPVDEYLDQTQGEAETRTLLEGRTYDYRGNQTTLQAVDNASATLAWTAPRTNTQAVGEGDVVALNGVEFVAHFPDAQTLVLDRDVEAYERQLEVQDKFDERVNGLWGVTILSGMAVVLLLGLSYLPSRY